MHISHDILSAALMVMLITGTLYNYHHLEPRKASHYIVYCMQSATEKHWESTKLHHGSSTHLGP